LTAENHERALPTTCFGTLLVTCCCDKDSTCSCVMQQNMKIS